MNADTAPAAKRGSSINTERIHLLDALRGFALLGVLLVHTNELAAITPAAGGRSGLLSNVALDLWAERFVRVFVFWKAQTLFTVMFGISFAIQMARLESRETDAGSVYRRRLLGLLVIGLLNVALLPAVNDILVFYALGGFVLMFMRAWETRALVGVGLLLALAVMPAASVVMGAPGLGYPRPVSPVGALGNVDLLAVNQKGSYWEIIQYHWLSVWFVSHIEWGLLTFLPFVIGRFMIGIAVLRTGLLTEPRRHRHALTWGAATGLPLGILLTVSPWIVRSAEDAGWIPDPHAWHTLALFLEQAGTLLLAAAYAALFALAWQAAPLRRLLSVFEPVGQTAVTNYLLQSVFNSLVFFGFGLGLFGRLGSALCLSVALGFFPLQCLISHLWLRTFQFGPVEWLWRAWTYRKRPAWRRAQPTAAV
ncbi:MAG: DUF418 domain-containing protein [Burkholderiales bacterium]